MWAHDTAHIHLCGHKGCQRRYDRTSSPTAARERDCHSRISYSLLHGAGAMFVSVNSESLSTHSQWTSSLTSNTTALVFVPRANSNACDGNQVDNGQRHPGRTGTVSCTWIPDTRVEPQLVRRTASPETSHLGATTTSAPHYRFHLVVSSLYMRRQYGAMLVLTARSGALASLPAVQRGARMQKCEVKHCACQCAQGANQ